MGINLIDNNAIRSNTKWAKGACLKPVQVRDVLVRIYHNFTIHLVDEIEQNGVMFIRAENISGSYMLSLTPTEKEPSREAKQKVSVTDPLRIAEAMLRRGITQIKLSAPFSAGQIEKVLLGLLSDSVKLHPRPLTKTRVIRELEAVYRDTLLKYYPQFTENKALFGMLFENPRGRYLRFKASAEAVIRENIKDITDQENLLGMFRRPQERSLDRKRYLDWERYFEVDPISESLRFKENILGILNRDYIDDFGERMRQVYYSSQVCELDDDLFVNIDFMYKGIPVFEGMELTVRREQPY